MKIKEISLTNFRNYKNETIKFSNDSIIILGDNAQGKTNLLESMYYTSTLRSFRTMDDTQLIRFGCDFGRIRIKIEKGNDIIPLQIVISKDGKYITYDGVPITKFSSFIGQLNAILFTPNDMKSFYSSPKERRRFLDMEIGKISSSYLNNLLIFQKLLKERNSYLKTNRIDMDYFDVLTEKLVEIEVQLILARASFIKLLENYTNIVYKKMVDENSNIHFIYHSCVDISTPDEMKRVLLGKYKQLFEREKIQQVTLIGVNREDITWLLNDINVFDYGSQGQKRSCILAIKLGLLEIVKLKKKEYPILLLDDVLSELDKNHRISLLNCIPDDVQVFITSTDINNEEINKSSTYYFVDDGKIKED